MLDVQLIKTMLRPQNWYKESLSATNGQKMKNVISMLLGKIKQKYRSNFQEEILRRAEAPYKRGN